MTFKHKLAHRLALLRAPAAALVLLASVSCTEGDLGSLAPYESMTLSGERMASISPKSVTIESGQPFHFKSTSDSPEGVKWTSTGGTITSEGGFKSASEGTFVVVSRVSLSGGEKVDTARVRVVRREDDRELSVSPRAVELLPGHSVQFTATAIGPDGAPAPAKVNWKVTGGSIDRDGNYIAGTDPGTYLLVAFIPSAGVADTVTVTISASARKAVRLLLAPATAAVVAGGVIKYTASAQYEDGSTEPVWASFGTSGGGTISPSGQEAEFTAGSEPGTFQVTAQTQDRSMQAQASVSVTSSGGVKEPALVTDTPLVPAPTPLPGLTGALNEPTGYQRFAELKFDSKLLSHIACSATATGSSGCWAGWGPNSSMKADASAPAGSNILQITFPAGLEPGYGETGLWGWSRNSSGNPIPYKEVYESGWVRIPTQDFEMQLTGVKLLGYWGVGDPTLSKPVQLFMGMDGNGTNTAPMSKWHLSFFEQNVHTWRRDQNVSLDKWFVAGQWHKYEIVMKLNDVGRTNGVLKIWLDGTLTHDYNNIEYRTAAYPAGFFGRNWHPMWGGRGGTAKTRDDHLWINHVYMSGLPM